MSAIGVSNESQKIPQSNKGSTQVRLPRHFDRLIVHQFDPARSSPGGIDTCLRGLARYHPSDMSLAFVGVDTGSGPAGRKLGRWERHVFGERVIYFLPVVRLDPADQNRTVPHSLRLVAGITRYRRRLPSAALVQAHRMDTALSLRSLIKGRHAYFVHTQENGLTGKTSDSFWRAAGRLHQRLERSVVTSATQVVVFNEDYARSVARWNPVTQFSPTWFDPRLIDGGTRDRDDYKVIWVGRLEQPKDPILAVNAFIELVERDPSSPWSLELLGSGTLLGEVESYVASLSRDIADRIRVRGRVEPEEVAKAMQSGGTFLMTSHAGYEGFPRVLVEALASGLHAVVTEGSDTGSLVTDAIGATTDREPSRLAAALKDALRLDRDSSRAAVAAMSAPNIVETILTKPLAPDPVPSLHLRNGDLFLGEAPVFTGPMDEFIEKIRGLFPVDQPELIATPNVDQLINLEDRASFRAVIRNAKLLSLDGAPLVALARALGARNVSRNTGADLLPALAANAVSGDIRIAIIGGAPGVSSSAAKQLRDDYPGSQVFHVPFPPLNEGTIAEQHDAIRELERLGVDVVFLCLGSPKQEEWFLAMRGQLPAALYIGAGAAVDFAAGEVKRAPLFIRRVGFEWAWRLLHEPRRLFGRYILKGPRFLPIAFRTIKGKSNHE